MHHHLLPLDEWWYVIKGPKTIILQLQPIRTSMWNSFTPWYLVNSYFLILYQFMLTLIGFLLALQSKHLYWLDTKQSKFTEFSPPLSSKSVFITENWHFFQPFISLNFSCASQTDVLIALQWEHVLLLVPKHSKFIEWDDPWINGKVYWHICTTPLWHFINFGRFK